jgi:hypothetical protein
MNAPDFPKALNGYRMSIAAMLHFATTSDLRPTNVGIELRRLMGTDDSPRTRTSSAMSGASLPTASAPKV